MLVFSVARLGEFTVPAIAKFDPSKHIMCQQVEFTNNHEGLLVIKFKLPVTKTLSSGKEVLKSRRRLV